MQRQEYGCLAERKSGGRERLEAAHFLEVSASAKRLSSSSAAKPKTKPASDAEEDGSGEALSSEGSSAAKSNDEQRESGSEEEDLYDFDDGWLVDDGVSLSISFLFFCFSPYLSATASEEASSPTACGQALYCHTVPPTQYPQQQSQRRPSSIAPSSGVLKKLQSPKRRD